MAVRAGGVAETGWFPSSPMPQGIDRLVHFPRDFEVVQGFNSLSLHLGRAVPEREGAC